LEGFETARAGSAPISAVIPDRLGFTGSAIPHWIDADVVIAPVWNAMWHGSCSLTSRSMGTGDSLDGNRCGAKSGSCKDDETQK